MEARALARLELVAAAFATTVILVLHILVDQLLYNTDSFYFILPWLGVFCVSICVIGYLWWSLRIQETGSDSKPSPVWPIVTIGSAYLIGSHLSDIIGQILGFGYNVLSPQHLFRATLATFVLVHFGRLEPRVAWFV
jgi:hypothetical protein